MHRAVAFAGFDGNGREQATSRFPTAPRNTSAAKPITRSTPTGSLKAELHCASDSYKFDLSSDVTARATVFSAMEREEPQHLRIFQGTAGGGQIDLFVEASGFAPT